MSDPHEPSVAAGTTPAVPSPGRRRLAFDGATGALVRLFLVNLVLTVLTLGAYRFWGRTRIRRFLWSHAQYMDEPFEYTGTGQELFVAFLLVLFVVIIPLTLTYWTAGLYLNSTAPELESLVKLLFYGGVLFLVGVARYRARRYRLSRSLWRGIRLAQTGSSLAYGGRYFVFTLLSLLTLGWFVPEKNIRLWAFAIDNTYFGTARFRYEGSFRHGLYKPFAIAWFLAIPTIGLSFAWYKAAELRLLAGRTRVHGLAFRFAPTGANLVGLVVPNLLLLVATLGLGGPLTQLRTARFLARHLELIGEPALEAIAQSTLAAPGIGEGLAEAFDMGTV